MELFCARRCIGNNFDDCTWVKVVGVRQLQGGKVSQRPNYPPEVFRGAQSRGDAGETYSFQNPNKIHLNRYM